jgi:hypothetical protein
MIAFLAHSAYHGFVQINKAFLDLLNSAKPTEKHWISLLEAGESNPEAMRQFLKADVAQSKLRGFVSAWIDSGIKPDGSEEPEHRSYLTWNCQHIFEVLGPVLNCLHTIPQKGVFALQAEQRAPKRLLGSLSARFNPRGGVELVPVLFSGVLSEEQIAAWGFYLFWQSPLPFKLMRCARCGVFEIPTRTRKPREGYMRGWHCRRCRNTASALANTADTRKAMRDKGLDLASDAYLDFERRPRRSTSDRTLFILERVNKGLPLGMKLKRHWVTHNFSHIVNEANRKAAANGHI